MQFQDQYFKEEKKHKGKGWLDMADLILQH